MRKAFKFLTYAMSLVAMLAFVHCGDEGPEPALKLNETELSAEGEGGSMLLGVASNISWSAISSEGWCVLENYTQKGDGSIILRIAPNTTGFERSAKITVSGGSLKCEATVKQAGSKSENGGSNEGGGSQGGETPGGNEGNGSGDDGGNTPTPTVKYPLTLGSSPSEGGTVSGGGSYESGKTVIITASPNPGYIFVKWSDGNTDASRTITVIGSQILTATFSPIFKISLSANPADGGTVSGGGSYDYGTSVTLKAEPNEGYLFSKWNDGVTTNPRTLTVTANKTLIAYFSQNSSNSSSGVAVNGKLPGKFSVSNTKQVSFSMGNLQYQASTQKWRFAENQDDIIGEDNENISSTYSGWIDLFGWGTSGNNSRYPYMTSTHSSDYASSDIGGSYDWGVYNAISNGGNKAGMWRTLTNAEWKYLYGTRYDASNLRGQATVNGQTGYVLLPDGWSTPSGLTFTANPNNFATNSYSSSEWSKMEAAGAVFLPCAGVRSGTTVNGVGSGGLYWSTTTIVGSNDPFSFGFNSSSVLPGSHDNCYYGQSVRLVQE